MNLKIVPAYLLLCAIVLAPPVFADMTTGPSEAAARKAIDAGNKAYLRALARGDASAFAAVHTQDAIEMPSSGRPIVRGRLAIQHSTTDDLRSTRYLDGSIVTTNVAVFGNMAYETGRYSFRYQEKGKQPASTAGRYFVAWERQEDGSYLIKIDSGFPQTCPK